MNAVQELQMVDLVRRLIEVDGLAIDRIAKAIGADPNAVYAKFMDMHHRVFTQMMGGKK